ncbi:RCC1/BLIP-II protein [Coniochaeta ligniaria NRRL 30616]|uniref:RCC1/BLIP-II protein n=1 Tax=Coniochaeta ligniaria NRRL 30616 TaxID=1408157 RepID=A0A1J7J2N3_9PEZI|nr:RCC1/BLIP-II protein [Coniochaeta ligniaria NRRL 30616]
MTTLAALGSNGSGQLGIGHKEDVSVPKQVWDSPDLASSSPITHVAAGGNHTLLLSDSGDLFWAGDSTSGACGRVSAEQTAAKPQFHCVKLTDPSSDEPTTTFKVGLVAATWEATIVTRLDPQGRNTSVYTFGAGTKGELGLGELIVRTPAPSRMAGFPPEGTEVVDLAACMGHVVAVLGNGDVYGWGNGRKGQLGVPDAVVSSPRKITDVGFKVARAVCGKDFTVLVGGADEPRVLFLGSDKWGIRDSLPATAEDWRDVRASWGNVYALRGEGALESWGRNDHGQMTPPGLPRISKIAVGSEHVLALDEEGNVLTWGWGEHGNCGPKVDDGDVKGRWNVIAFAKYLPPDCKVTSIGAGCATSWIVVGHS